MAKICCYDEYYREDGDAASVYRHTVDEIWSSERLRRLRRAMAAGERPPTCARCHDSEDRTGASMRTLDLIQECSTLLGTLPQAEAVHADTVSEIRSRLSEITAAQGYQDLTGQIILRVVKLVRAVHEGLGEHRVVEDDALHLSRGTGPAVAGLDPAPASQDDANQLLSSLGL